MTDADLLATLDDKDCVGDCLGRTVVVEQGRPLITMHPSGCAFVYYRDRPGLFVDLRWLDHPPVCRITTLDDGRHQWTIVDETPTHCCYRDEPPETYVG